MAMHPAFGTQFEGAVEEPIFCERDCRNLGNVAVMDAANFVSADQASP